MLAAIVAGPAIVHMRYADAAAAVVDILPSRPGEAVKPRPAEREVMPRLESVAAANHQDAWKVNADQWSFVRIPACLMPTLR
jgi:hypothetical protein